MPINQSYKFSYWSFDQEGFLLEESNDWSKGDSLGRNAFMYIFHPNEKWLKDTLMKCVKKRDDGLIQFYRYPNWGADTISRDHVGAVILALYINRDWEDLRFILKDLPLQLSKRYWQTLDFWLWQRSLYFEIQGKKWKFWIFRQLFFLLTLVQMILIVPWNFILRKLLGLVKFDPGSAPTKKLLTGWKKWVYQKMIYPKYALYNLVWSCFSLNLNKYSLLTKLINLEADNPVLKAILGREISEEEFYNYVPIGSFQWAGSLDNGIEWIPRTLDKGEHKFNDLTYSNLCYFYYGIDRIMKQNPTIHSKVKNNENIIFY